MLLDKKELDENELDKSELRRKCTRRNVTEPYHMIIHALQTVLHLNKKICLMYNYRLYNNLF